VKWRVLLGIDDIRVEDGLGSKHDCVLFGVYSVFVLKQAVIGCGQRPYR
jgi:hypothetical protein